MVQLIQLSKMTIDYGSFCDPCDQCRKEHDQSNNARNTTNKIDSYNDASSSLLKRRNDALAEIAHLAELDQMHETSTSIILIISLFAGLLVSIICVIEGWAQTSPAPELSMDIPQLRRSFESELEEKGERRLVPNPNAYPRRDFITHDRLNQANITLPVMGFPSLALAQFQTPSEQHLANDAVQHAVEDLQISYFDVAPEYGDGIAQSRLGPALKPYRQNVFLAAKTMYRDDIGAETDLKNTLEALETDHLNLYQFHSISTEADVDQILGEGGAMETFLKAKSEGKIGAIGFSAHSEPMAVKMIRSGLVDTCMFPINFAAYHFGGVGKQVLKVAREYGVGVIALKAGARGRLTSENGNSIVVPEEGELKHIPEWKRQEMLHFPVMTSKDHPLSWYEPEDDPVFLNKLILWSLNQPGVTAVLPPGVLELLDGISDELRGKREVPQLEEGDVEMMLERYRDIVPIFHDWDESGTKVST